jgi:hypothetical protein
MTMAGAGKSVCGSAREKWHFRALRACEARNRLFPGRAGNTVEQNRVRTLPREAVRSIGLVGIGE